MPRRKAPDDTRKSATSTRAAARSASPPAMPARARPSGGREPAAAPRRRSPPPADPRSAILRAAGEILDEVGIDGLNTTAVARRANVSTGTVYREFKDKQDILRALMQALLTERGDTAAAHYSRLASEADWRAVLAEASRTAYRLRMQRPGGRSTRRALQASPELWQWDLDHTRALAHRLAQSMRKRQPALTAARADLVAMVSLTITVALFDLANLEPRREKALLGELLAARDAYLALYLDPPAGGPCDPSSEPTQDMPT